MVRVPVVAEAPDSHLQSQCTGSQCVSHQQRTCWHANRRCTKVAMPAHLYTRTRPVVRVVLSADTRVARSLQSAGAVLRMYGPCIQERGSGRGGGRQQKHVVHAHTSTGYGRDIERLSLF